MCCFLANSASAYRFEQGSLTREYTADRSASVAMSSARFQSSPDIVGARGLHIGVILFRVVETPFSDERGGGPKMKWMGEIGPGDQLERHIE